MEAVQVTRLHHKIFRQLLVPPASMIAAGAALGSRGNPGKEYVIFGRRIARQLIAERRHSPGLIRSSLELLINPVALSRMYEFDFCGRHLPPRIRTALDLSSPRLFSLYQTKQRADLEIFMANPDGEDISGTDSLVTALRVSNVKTGRQSAQELNPHERYDVAWSISVLEHIAGPTGDTDAIIKLAGAIRPGGRLIITVPVDRVYREDYRRENTYGLPVVAQNGLFFFERRYDLESLHHRLIYPIGAKSVTLVWAGETERGWWDDYLSAWRKWGAVVRARDEYLCLRRWSWYTGWEHMPGAGICGLVFDL